MKPSEAWPALTEQGKRVSLLCDLISGGQHIGYRGEGDYVGQPDMLPCWCCEAIREALAEAWAEGAEETEAACLEAPERIPINPYHETKKGSGTHD